MLLLLVCTSLAGNAMTTAALSTAAQAAIVAPRPRVVYLNKELENASVIAYCEVQKDHLGNLIYQPLNGVRPKAIKGVAGPTFTDGASEPGTGYWPRVGEQVLVVLNKEGELSIFAHKVGDHYRFWSPSFTGSVALFHYQSPALPLPDCESITEMDGSEWQNCWDGALYPIAELTERLR